MHDNSDTVTISRKEYDELQRGSEFLDCLRGAGVDNWDGYDDACQMFRELGDEA